jgi:hypothetical protein
MRSLSTPLILCIVAAARLAAFAAVSNAIHVDPGVPCVPASCCHPTSCVSAAEAPDCSAVSCDASCQEGTLDCGYGHCVVSEDGTCGVSWASDPADPGVVPPLPQEEQPPRKCQSDADCVPFPCCAPAGCVNPDEAKECMLVRCAYPGVAADGANYMMPPRLECTCDPERHVCSSPPPPPIVDVPPPDETPRSPCQDHKECVPNDCCRPDRCVNANEAPTDCSGVFCGSFAAEEWHVKCWCDAETATCGSDISVSTPVRSEDGGDVIYFDPPAMPPSDPECAGGECCHSTFCVLASEAPTCDLVPCTKECRSGTLDCGYARCAYDKDANSCSIEFQKPTARDSGTIGGDSNPTRPVRSANPPICPSRA